MNLEDMMMVDVKMVEAAELALEKLCRRKPADAQEAAAREALNTALCSMRQAEQGIVDEIYRQCGGGPGDAQIGVAHTSTPGAEAEIVDGQGTELFVGMIKAMEDAEAQLGDAFISYGMVYDAYSVLEAMRSAFCDAIDFVRHPDTRDGVQFLDAWMSGDYQTVERFWPTFDISSTRTAYEHPVLGTMPADELRLDAVPGNAVDPLRVMRGQAITAGAMGYEEVEELLLEGPFGVFITFGSQGMLEAALEEGWCAFEFVKRDADELDESGEEDEGDDECRIKRGRDSIRLPPPRSTN